MQESSFGKRPDLILVDGGVGQVGAAKAALAKLGEDIAVMGLVKDSHHRTDHLFFEGRKIPLKEIRPSIDSFTACRKKCIDLLLLTIGN